MRDHDASAPQRLASAPEVSAWVGANAGSGKTRVLTERVARLLLAGAEPGRILCLTYTKAAAAEMQARLFALLGDWSMQPDGALGRMLGDLAGEAEVTSPERLAVARRLFARALETPGGLKIQTIHAFCDSLLRRFPLEAGVAPGFEVIDERQSALMLGEIRDRLASAAEAGSDEAFDLVANRLNEGAIGDLINAILSRRSGFSGPDAETLILRQLGKESALSSQAIATHHLDSLRGLMERVAAVFATGSVGDNGIADQVASALEKRANDPIGAAKALAGAVLVKSGERGGQPLKNKPTQPVRTANPGIDDAFLELAEGTMAMKEALARRASAERAHDLHIFAERLLQTYQAEKARRSLLDFDDLISRTRDLLSQSEMRAWVLYKLDRGIDHVLVDEAQDTSPAQWDVIAAITDDFHAGEAGRADQASLTRSVFVVGDEKQSIYSFQGAEPWAFGEMRERYERQLADIDDRLERPELVTSFRSAPGILRFVDEVFDGEVADGVTHTGDPIRHVAHRGGDAARIDLWPLIEPAEAPERPPWHMPVDTPSPDDPKRRLARTLAQEIRRIIAEEHLPGRGGAETRPILPQDILVLVRKRDELARALIQNLKSLDVPVAGADRLTLSEELAIKDLLSLIKAVLNQDDALSLAEVLRSPLCSVSEEELFDLAHDRKGSLWQAVMGAEAHARDVGMLADLASVAGFVSPFEFLERVLTHHDGRRRLIARLGPEAEDPIDELLAQALVFEARQTPSLHGFVAWIEAGDIALKREMDKAAGEVRVMTIHGAKGLEAPIVILPDTMGQGRGGRHPILPTPRASGTPLMLWPQRAAEDDPVTASAREEAQAREAAEAKRLLYVALTRAEDWLLLCGAGNPDRSEKSWYARMESAFDRMGPSLEVDLTGLKAPIRRMQSGDWPSSAMAKETVELIEPQRPEWVRPAPGEYRLRRLSPSSLAPHDESTTASGVDRTAARRRGEAVHALLEHLPSVDRAHWDVIVPRLISEAAPGLDPAVAGEVKAEAIAVLEDPDLAWIFADGTLGEVEVSFATELSGAFPMLGRIDRLVIGEQSVTIVDFKSDAAAPVSEEEIPEAYLAQLGAYRAALNEIYPDKEIVAGLLFTRTRQLIRPKPEALDHAYMSAIRGIDLAGARS
ncbi:MAG: double-strand break repair helicase AddA [Pseudomonadota bacterium]